MADLVTDNLALPKPKATNQLSVDVERLRTALDGIDTAVAGKASASTVTAHISNLTNPHGTTAAQVGAIPASAGAVTDAYVGNRTVDPTVTPAGNTGTLTALLSGLSSRVRAITGATNWTDTPATTLAAAKSHLDSVSNPHATTAAQVGAIPSTNGSVTDALVGSRTVNPALSNPGSSGTITQLLSWIAGRIRAITGTTNWFDAPATTLASAATHHSNTSNPHATTAAQVASASGFGSGAWGISVSGNAATATILATPRTINGVLFDGSANIEVNMIKSVRRSTLAFSVGDLSKTYTLNPAVNVDKTFISHLGVSATGSNDSDDNAVRLSLTNSTTVTATRASNTSSVTVSFEVIEFT